MSETITLEAVRSLAANLSPEQRLELIRTIVEAGVERGSLKVDNWRTKLKEEANYWYARSLEDRKPYLGNYVAVHNKKVIDHDMDRRALYLRIHARYPNTPVLIVRAEAQSPSEFTVLSPRLERVAP